jgi:hypothetical protein
MSSNVWLLTSKKNNILDISLFFSSDFDGLGLLKILDNMNIYYIYA